jgi:hypothetical protein
MPLPEENSNVICGEEAAIFLNKIFEEKPVRPLLVETKNSIEELVRLAEEYQQSED